MATNLLMAVVTANGTVSQAGVTVPRGSRLHGFSLINGGTTGDLVIRSSISTGEIIWQCNVVSGTSRDQAFSDAGFKIDGVAVVSLPAGMIATLIFG
mgnify:CR=1 FL=1